MLVYIRFSDWDRLMSCGGKEEISEGLRKRFEMEQRDKEARQKMKVEAHLYCTVKLAMDEDMMTQVGSDSGGVFFDLADHDQLPSDKMIRLKKSLKFSEIKIRVQELTGVPPSSQRFWTFAENKSQSYRPSKPLSAEDEVKPLMELKDLRDTRQSGSSKKVQSLMDFKLYVQLPRVFAKEGGQILSPQATLSSYSPRSDIFLFFKFYDPVKNAIRFKGSLTVMKSQTVTDLSKYCCRMSGLAADTPLDFYEEIRSDPVTVRPLGPR
jgi:ubiquitin carboxyl-terminal hydrolase 7